MIGKGRNLEQVLERGVDSGVGNEGQGVVRQEGCALAQRCPPCLQVLLEVRNPLLKLSSVLGERYGFESGTLY